MKVDTLFIPREEVSCILDIIQENEMIEDDIINHIRVGLMSKSSWLGYNMIRMCHQGLNVSSTTVVKPTLLYMRRRASQ